MKVKDQILKNMSEGQAVARAKLAEVRGHPQAEAAATAMNVTGGLLEGAAMFGLPAAGLLATVLKTGGTILNPATKMADLKRTEAAIQGDIREVKDLMEDLKDSFTKYKALSLKLTTDIRFKADWEEVEAAHTTLMLESHSMEEAVRMVQPGLFNIKTKYNRSLNIEKITEFANIVKDTEGVEEALETLSYAVVVKVLYLNMMVTIAAYQNDVSTIGSEFERFNSDICLMKRLFQETKGLCFQSV